MPNGNAGLAAAPGSDPKNPNQKPSAMNTNSMLGQIESVFMDEIVDYVDENYRTINDKAHRAIAGLSLGGLHTLFISMNNPTKFDYSRHKQLMLLMISASAVCRNLEKRGMN